MGVTDKDWRVFEYKERQLLNKVTVKAEGMLCCVLLHICFKFSKVNTIILPEQNMNFH